MRNEHFLRSLIMTLGQSPVECLAIIGLDRAFGFRTSGLIEGDFCSATTNYRTIFGEALRTEAFALIVAHNHPSGAPRPSAADIQATRHLCALAQPLQVEIVDHLIITSSSAFSMRAAGMLECDCRGPQ